MRTWLMATGFLLGGVTVSAQTRPARDSGPVPMVTKETPGVRTEFVNGMQWADTEGNHINAHGGGVLFREGVCYWYGENRASRLADNTWVDSPGVSCYSSKDLYNWKNEGVVFRTVEEDAGSPVAKGCNIERPKVIFNEKTKTFVMWMHLELKGRGYGAALAALATSNSPTGPFVFQKALRPNAGKWPVNLPEEARVAMTPEEVKGVSKEQWREAMVKGLYTRRDFAGGQMSRDMTLFVDEDKKGYLLSSSEENWTFLLHELDESYTGFTGKYLRIAPGGQNEGPALVKHGGRYYLLASGCTGWAPNAARVIVSDNIWGPWKQLGNPCRGSNPLMNMGPEKTWGGQSTCVFPVVGKPDAYIAMFDLWRPKNLITSGYVWVPAGFEGESLRLTFRERWDLSVFDK